jgi:beta-RFAP synthase
MIEEPGVEVRLEPRPDWVYTGPLAERVRDLVGRILSRGGEPPGERPLPPACVEVVSAPAEHTGLGVGSQLSLAITQGLATLSGWPELTPSQLATLSGRGRRSGIGLHGFRLGGLIVDGGRRDDLRPPPLVVRSSFPEEWSILLVQPPGPRGRHGDDEVRSFADLPPLPDHLTDRLCRLVLLGMLPALAERELRDFGEALSELQRHVGAAFAPLQGGPYSSPVSEALVEALGRMGLVGAGQSSWGPTLYAFGELSERERTRIRDQIEDQFGLDASRIRWTRAANHGALLEWAPPLQPS